MRPRHDRRPVGGSTGLNLHLGQKLFDLAKIPPVPVLTLADMPRARARRIVAELEAREAARGKLVAPREGSRRRSEALAARKVR